MEQLVKQISDKKHTKMLDKHLDSLHTELKHVEHSFRKPDLLRVTNSLRATARMSEALTRQVFLQDIAARVRTYSELPEEDKDGFLENFEYVLTRELEGVPNFV